MRISDMEGVHNARNEQDVIDLLDKRLEEGVNDFYITHGAKEFPALIVLVNNALAYVNFIPSDGEPGSYAVGDDRLSLRADGETIFKYGSPYEDQMIQNYQVISIEHAKDVVESFFREEDILAKFSWESL